MLFAAIAGLIDWPGMEAMAQGALAITSPLGSPNGRRLAGNVTIVSDAKALEQLAAGWSASDSNRSAAPFQTWSWMRIMMQDAALHDVAPLILFTGTPTHPKVIMPLAIERRFGVRIARWLGEPLVQYGDAVKDPRACDEDLAACWQVIQGLPVDLVLLRNVRDDAAIVPLLHAKARTVGLETSRYLDLDRVKQEGFDSVAGPRTVKRNRVAERKLAAQGVLDFHVHVGPSARRWAEAAIMQKQEWLAARGLHQSPLEDTAWRQALATLASEPGGAVSTLFVDGKLAAAEIGFHHQGHYIAYLGSYADALAVCSPGRTQMRATIEWCCEQGFSSYDLLAPDDHYKVDWTCASTAVHDFAQPLTRRGKAYLVLQSLRPQIKALFYALPPTLRRIVSSVLPR